MNAPDSARERHQSLRAHARNTAAQDHAYNAQETLRFFAFSRFLARVFADQPDDWALKGAGALLARIPVAWASNDLDLVTRSSLELVEGRLRQAAVVDLEDGFTFTIMSGSRPITGNNRGRRFTAEARIGPHRLAAFSAGPPWQESRRRGITLPPGYLPPDQAMWERGFTKLRRAAGPLGAKRPSYPEAVTIAQGLVDPILAGERHDGTWDAAKRQLVDENSRSGAR